MTNLVKKARFQLMRRFTNKGIRDTIIKSQAKRISKNGRFSGASLFTDGEDYSTHKKELSEDGISFFPLKLSKDKIEELKAFASKLKCHDPYRKHLGSFTLDDLPVEARLAS